ncbi:MAG: hypothetical protein KatS3mg076_2859 [Candidatus Binatia bacterium]|nr:MAG: hypothetical protein KatS3mg076_2859 [Candidatus Binatia bacterium]
MARASSSGPYRIVCIGGGTGLPVLLRGLREYRRRNLPGSEKLDLSAVTPIVAFSDDGGSSGRLVKAYGVLPPGDLRNCLLALADPEIEPLMTHFFNHRFGPGEGETLAGHSAGNLFLLALSQLHGGDVRKAILDAGRLLGIEGKIVFPTLAPAVLCAQLEDGSVVVGESAIASRANPAPISRVFLARRGSRHPKPEKAARLPATPEAIEAIEAADAIVLGPGSLYSSVVASLLVPDVAEAVRRARAVKIYVANLMVEPGETDDYSLEDHVRALYRHGRIRVDYVLANRSRVDPTLARLYLLERLEREVENLKRALDTESRRAVGQIVPLRVARIRSLLEQVSRPRGDRGQVLARPGQRTLAGARVVGIDAVRIEEIREANGSKRVLRHDPEKLVRAVLGVLSRARRGA